MDKYMNMAVDAALDNANGNTGGPFGAVVVKNGKIIGVGRNQVTSLNDPTAHAEIQAIREACQFLQSFQLDDCEIYTSCEPCPMCLGAIFWARPKAVYYACTKEDAARAGFDDQFIYEQIELPPDQRTIPMKQIPLKSAALPFQAWTASNNKVEY